MHIMLPFAASALLSGTALANHEQGRWTVGLNVGINPTIAQKDGNILLIPMQQVFFQAGVVQTSPAANFGKQYKLPLNFGADVGYFICKQIETFGELSYTTSTTKTYTYSTGSFKLTHNYNRYNEFRGFVGTRYHFTSTSSPIIPFVGFKFGYSYMPSTDYTEIVDGSALGQQPYTQSGCYYRHRGTLAGGLQIGFDYLLNKKFSLGVKAEAVLAGPLVGNRNMRNSQGLLAAVFPNTKQVYSFPISATVKYTF